MAIEIRRRHGAQGFHGLSLMPAGIPAGLQVHIPDEFEKQGRESVAVASDTRDSGRQRGECSEDSDMSEETYSASQLAPGYAPRAYYQEGENKCGLGLQSLLVITTNK